MHVCVHGYWFNMQICIYKYTVPAPGVVPVWGGVGWVGSCLLFLAVQALAIAVTAVRSTYGSLTRLQIRA